MLCSALTFSYSCCLIKPGSSGKTGPSLEKCINTPYLAVGELKASKFACGKMQDLGNTVPSIFSVPKQLPTVGSKLKCNGGLQRPSYVKKTKIGCARGNFT